MSLAGKCRKSSELTCLDIRLRGGREEYAAQELFGGDGSDIAINNW